MRSFGEQNGLCPYFLSRHLLPTADILIYSYYYLLDPKISEIISKHLTDKSIVIFDEGHNIDNVALEVLSVDLHQGDLERAAKSCEKLNKLVKEIKGKDTEKLKNEYKRLLEGLRKKSGSTAVSADLTSSSTADWMANPIIPEDIIEEAVPGNIRKADHFLSFLKRLIEYLKAILKGMTTTSESPISFLAQLQSITLIERKPLKFTTERLNSIVKTLELTAVDELSSLVKVAHFATLLATYSKGFSVIFEPIVDIPGSLIGGEDGQISHTMITSNSNPILHLVCLDPAIIMAPLIARFDNLVITSGTLSPLEMYPKILSFSPKIAVSLPMSVARPCFLPLFVTRGADQVMLSTRFSARQDLTLFRNYGQLVVEFCKSTPDGIVLFFPSYYYMKSALMHWQSMGILNEILTFKLIFVETTDAAETSSALANFKMACDRGRGALFVSVARGKIAEGVDFEHHYGRAVLQLGVPFQYTESLLLKAKLEYLRENYNIREVDYLTFDAMRQAAQCLGRVIRNKNDYGLMILADSVTPS